MNDKPSYDVNNILPGGRKDIFKAAKEQISKCNFVKSVLILVWVVVPLGVTRSHLASLKKKGGN